MSAVTPVQLSGVHLGLGGRAVLRDLSLSVPAGTVYALLGGNGAGKSTILSVLLGFLVPSAGRVLVNGTDPSLVPRETRAGVAYLPENVALYEHLSATENAAYLLSLAGGSEDPAGIAEAFRAVGLQEDAWNRRLAGFSKGMRQKVAIAVALRREVPVVLLDEPTSGLDPRASTEFHALLDTIRARGAAVLMVTHDLLGAVGVADRIGFLQNGRIAREEIAGNHGFDLPTLVAQVSGTQAA